MVKIFVPVCSCLLNFLIPSVLENMIYLYIDEYFSFCLEILFYVELGSIFSNNRKYIWVRQAFASIQHGFFRSAENADLHNIIDVDGESIDFLLCQKL